MIEYSSIEFLPLGAFAIDSSVDRTPPPTTVYLVPRERVTTEVKLPEGLSFYDRYSPTYTSSYAQITPSIAAWPTAVTLASRFGGGDGRKGHIPVVLGVTREILEDGSRYLITISVTLHNGRVVTIALTGVISTTSLPQWHVVEQPSDLYTVGVSVRPTTGVVTLNVLDVDFKLRVFLLATVAGIVSIRELLLNVPKLAAKTVQ